MASLEYPPYAFKEGGHVRGIAIDIVAESLRRCNKTAHFSILPWVRVLAKVKDGTKDGVVVAARNAEREQYLNYSREVNIAQDIILFASTGSRLTFDGDTSMLSGRSVTLLRGQYLGKNLDTLLKTGVLQQTVFSNSNESCIIQLITNRADLWPVERNVALWTLQNAGLQDRLQQIGPPIETIPTFVAFTKVRDTTALRDSFDVALKSTKKNGPYDKIFQSYIK